MGILLSCLCSFVNVTASLRGSPFKHLSALRARPALQHAVEALLGDDGQRPERIVVVMDCSGVSVLGATRIAGVFKAVCSSLNQHFPMR